MKRISILLLIPLSIFLSFCTTSKSDLLEVQQWKEVAMAFISEKTYENPYTDVEFWVEFNGPNEQKVIRPGYWEKENIWKVRFASPTDNDEWTWKSFASNEADGGLHGKTGKLKATPYKGDNPLIKNGLLRMSAGKRNVIHANGKPFLMIGDTPWVLPWRSTYESVTLGCTFEKQHCKSMTSYNRYLLFFILFLVSLNGIPGFPKKELFY